MDTEFIVQIVLWLIGFIFLWRIPLCHENRSGKILKQSLSIIIPARNEEKNLPGLLCSLKEQLDINDEIIVIDDHSEDATSKQANIHGARVILSQPLPTGWLGKTWACFQGAQSAKGELLLFLDADTIIESNGIKKIISSFEFHRGAFSIQPYHRMQKLYEQFSAFFNIVIMGAMGTFTILGKKIKPLGLFGPAVLLTKKLYFESGGFEKVKGEVLEDLEYGAALKKQNVPIFCYGGNGSISFRMYPEGVGQLVNGWSKGFAKGAFKTSIPILILVVAWITGAVGTTRNLVEAIAYYDLISIVSWVILYVAYAAQIYWMLRRIGNFRFFTATFFPIPLVFFIFVFTYSSINIFILRRVHWKGRKIDIKHGGDK